MADMKARLSALVGRTVNYQNAEYMLIGWEIGAQDVTIEHEAGQLHIQPEKLEAVVVAWESAVQRRTGVVLPTAAPDVVTPTTTLHDVNQLLLDSMRRVRDDPAYAPQAKALADTAQVIINSAKAQVEAARVIAQMQRK